MTPEFELACYARKDAFYTKDRLIEVGDKFMGKKSASAAEKKTERPAEREKTDALVKKPVVASGGPLAAGKAVKE
jgi:formate hydrogenlyase subunit 6/NADH:ubiquinone oxidoreductase subunit I